MNRFVLIILAIIFLLISSSALAGNDYYVGQSAAGGNTGANCSNQYALTFLNSAGNWGVGAGKINPGDTVHLCGTITSQIAIAGSGSAGSNVTIKFESGAIMSAAYWGTGAIYCTGQQYITIDGNNVGVITATANGTALANQNTSYGVYNACNNSIVKNLQITNQYVHTYNNTDNNLPANNAIGIFTVGASTVLVSGNTVTDSSWGIMYQNTSGATTTGITMSNNKVFNCCWGIQGIIGAAGSTVTNMTINNNEIQMGMNWMSVGGTDCHLNGSYSYSSTDTNATLNNYKFYNNYIHGPTTCNGQQYICTAFMHYDYGAGNGSEIYNNLLVSGPCLSTTVSNGYLSWGLVQEASPQFYNNTVISQNNIGPCIGTSTAAGGGSPVIKNNICVNTYEGIYASGTGDVPVADNNIYYNNLYPGILAGPVYYSTLANWQTGLGGCPGAGHECNSSTSNPNLAANYSLNAGSPAIGAGANLSSIFTTDYNGNTRTVPWDIGAIGYNLSGGGTSSPDSMTCIGGTAKSINGNLNVFP